MTTTTTKPHNPEPKPEWKIIGSRFKSVRVDTLRKDQPELAEETGMSIKTINFIEKGKAMPNQKVLTYLENQYNINSHWITTGKGNRIGTAKEDPDHSANIQARLSLLETQVSEIKETMKTILSLLQGPH